MVKDFSKQLEEFRNLNVHMESNPAVIYIESIKGCPYSCAMCSERHTTPQKISKDLLRKLEPYFNNLEVMAIHGAGEPLLADLKYFVEKSIGHDFVLHMNTTGFFLTKQKADLLLKTRRLSIRFSIHAGKAETYKKIMGNDFAKVKESIFYLTNKARNSGKSCDFCFSFIVMKENIDEIEDFLHFAHDCGIQSVRFMRLFPSAQSLLGFKGIKMEDRDFEFKYFEQFNKEIKNKFLNRLPSYQCISNKLGINIEFGSIQSYGTILNSFKLLPNVLCQKFFAKKIFPLIRMKGSCIAPWFGQLIINQEGDVNLCCSIHYPLGNLNDSPLSEIWNSKKIKAIRNSFRKGYYPRACGYCKGFNLDNYPKNSFIE